MSQPLRIIFMGTPDFSVGALNALIQSRHKVVCVYSQPPREKGRGQQVQKSCVHVAADVAGIEVRHPKNFKNADDIKDFQNLKADVAVVAAYGLILPKTILDAPPYGCINIHASLLPRWRGAAPIQRSILAGDDKTGITIMQMDVGLDTGPMIKTESIGIDENTTASLLHDSLSMMGARMIVLVMDELADKGNLQKTPQPDTGETYAAMLKKEEGKIDWSDNAQFIGRQIRALNPWPSTWTFNQKGQRFKIIKAVAMKDESKEQSGFVLSNDGCVVCGAKSILKIETIQPDNKKPMVFSDCVRGGYIVKGDVLK